MADNNTDGQVTLNQYSTENRRIPAADQNGTIQELTVGPGVRERILHEATRLFSTKGFNGVSVREIVDAAGITKPTLYYYFPSKEQLFERIIMDSLEEFRRQVEWVAGQPGPVRDRLIQFCRIHFEFARSSAEQCELIHTVSFSTERNAVHLNLDAYMKRNAEIIRDVIAEGMATGELRAADPWLTALAFMGAVHIFILAMLRDPGAVPSDGLAEVVAELIWNGLGRVRSPGETGNGVSP